MATRRTTKKDEDAKAAETPDVEMAVQPDPVLGIVDVEMLNDEELASTLKVLRAENRRRMKEREAHKPRMGDRVKVLRGSPKHVGKIGTAVVVRRTRCFVAVPGIDSPAYLLVTDVERVEEE